MEPLMLEIGAGFGGFKVGTTVGVPVAAGIGGAGGLLTTAQITDSDFWQPIGAAAGAVRRCSISANYFYRYG
jgi:hypothetical protein